MTRQESSEARGDARNTRAAVWIVAAGLAGGIGAGLGIGWLMGDALVGVGVGLAAGAGAGGVLASLVYTGEV